MTRILITIVFFLSIIINLQAQDFRWGKRGGSTTLAGLGGPPWENVVDMATDRNGNTYILSNVLKNNIDVSGTLRQGYGQTDEMLSSYSCDGKLRWVKLLGTKEADNPRKLRTDKVDGVYVASWFYRFYYDTVFIDNDTTITAKEHLKGNCLIKFDTSGNFKWLRMPEPDSVSFNTTSSKNFTIDVDIDSAGNSYWFMQLSNGLYAGSYAVSSLGDYMLKYDRSGNFLGGHEMDIFYTGAMAGQTDMVRDSKTGKYFVSGYRYVLPTDPNSIFIGLGDSIKNSKYLVCFAANGKYLWKRENDSLLEGLFNRPVIDNEGNIYLAGITNSAGPTSLPADKFLTFTSTHGNGYGTPFVVKLNNHGNIIWAADAIVNAATSAVGGIALRNSGEVVLLGTYPGKVVWPGFTKDSLYLPPNSGYRPFITRFNTTTGKVLGVHALSGGGNTAEASICSDGRNNVYIGGYFKSTLTVNGSQMSIVGGETDWFVAKYGHDNCGCTNIPEPRFSYLQKSPGVYDFTYTGTSGNTSIEWDFGDGATSTTLSPTHSFPTATVYTVCVTVKNTCGDNTSCQTIFMWPSSVNQLTNDEVKLYPNPTNDVLHIKGVTEGSIIQLFDMMGRSLHKSIAVMNKESIEMGYYNTGSYILHVTDIEGRLTIHKVIKY